MEKFNAEEWLLLVQQGSKGFDNDFLYVVGVMISMGILFVIIFSIVEKWNYYASVGSFIAGVIMWFGITSVPTQGEYYSLAIAQIVQHPNKEEILKDPTIRDTYDSIVSYVLKQANEDWYIKKIEGKLRRN